MESNDKLIDVLNNLVQINNDRIVGYQKAIEETRPEDNDLVAFFQRMIEESRSYKMEVQQVILPAGGVPDDNHTTNSGKLYRVWMGIKATFSGHSRQAVLDSCEYGENAVQRAYQEALQSFAEVNTGVRGLIIRQKASLGASHDLIKEFRITAEV